jgi:hypothetical protein
VTWTVLTLPGGLRKRPLCHKNARFGVRGRGVKRIMSESYGTEFVERQSFAPFVYGLMLVLVAVLVFLPPHNAINIIPLVAVIVVGNLLYEVTTVSRDVVTVRFGLLFPLYVRTVRCDEIEGLEAVTYSPIGEYGGWGIRGIGANVALNARGDRGVRLSLTGNRRLLIGSQRPEELAQAILAAKRS